jgi:uncharacterized protein DUF4424
MRNALTAVGIAAAIAALGWGSALANDSTAELATGGLVLTKNAAIQMRSEDLYISATQIRVHYRFLNTAKTDQTVTVAFPMPDITTEGFDDMFNVPTEDPVNLLGFHTLVDGKPVVAQPEQKAIKDGVDRTAWLKAHGIPLAPHLKSTNDLLDKLPPALQAEMVKMNLAVEDDYDDTGKGMVKHFDATWTLKTTYYWRQTFPAGRELDVQHVYTPSLGESAATAWGDPKAATDGGYNQAAAKRFCIDNDFLSAVQRSVQPGHDNEAPYTEQRVEYVLKSGANWAAPIGDFRMVIDKGSAQNLVSFCGDGVKKISPTQFEVHHTNFTPTADVSVLILLPIPNS